MDGLGSLITNLGRLSMMDGHYQICGVLAGVVLYILDGAVDGSVMV
jgi:hypothetical protein